MSDVRNTRVVGLVRDTDRGVLALDEALPEAVIGGDNDEEQVPQVRAAFAELLGIEMVVVRTVARTLDDERHLAEVALELEPLEPVALPPGARWLDASDRAREAMPERHRELLDRLFGDDGHPLRPPWAHRGWYAEAVAWIDDALEDVGRRRTGPVEQRSNWCISSILRAPTADGDVYLKATARSPLFGDEGVVTRGLAERFPGQIPMPLAVEEARQLMLLDDFGAEVGWKADLETRADVLSRYAAMQVESASMTNDLLALGAFDRSPAWLAGALERLLDDPHDLLGLEREERARLDDALPRFVEWCGRLADGPMPLALVHGDLHLSNVARNGDGYVFFDWTDACVAHPLMDLLLVFFEEIQALQEALREAYLSAWVETASPDELLDIWRIAQPLAALNQAVSYRSIVDNVEPGTGDEIETMLPWWLRKALEAVD